MKCEECRVWGNGVRISYDWVRSGSMPQAAISLQGPWQSHRTCTGCRNHYLDEFPTKECAFCGYCVCSKCAGDTKCKSRTCGRSRAAMRDEWYSLGAALRKQGFLAG
eukprot:5437812-Prymnesium_polylepis.1